MKYSEKKKQSKLEDKGLFYLQPILVTAHVSREVRGQELPNIYRQEHGEKNARLLRCWLACTQLCLPTLMSHSAGLLA